MYVTQPRLSWISRMGVSPASVAIYATDIVRGLLEQQNSLEKPQNA